MNCSALNKAFMPWLFKVQRIPYKKRKKECKSKNKRGEKESGRCYSLDKKKKNRKEKKGSVNRFLFVCLLFGREMGALRMYLREGHEDGL